MEPISQVVLRNRNRWGDGPVLLVDMPADGLESALREAGLALRASNQEFGTYKALSARGTAAEFAPAPRAERGEALIVLRLPREKERFAMVLHALAASMDSDARLWVVGEKRAGIKSAGRLLEQRFALVDRLDNARHCSLLEARAPRACPPFRLDDLGATLSVDAGASRLRLCSLPGVFAHRRVDGGTALLLDALEDCAVHGRVLDFACGNGIVGIGLLKRRAAAWRSTTARRACSPPTGWATSTAVSTGSSPTRHSIAASTTISTSRPIFFAARELFSKRTVE
ncbi:MAG: methyltransferase [Xanthomonadales bacterium]